MTPEENEVCRKAFYECQYVSKDQFPTWIAAWEVAIEHQKARNSIRSETEGRKSTVFADHRTRTETK